MHTRFHPFIIPLLISACLSLAWAGKSVAEENITLNFANADIEAVIKAVGQVSGRHFLIDPRVKGSINLISHAPLPSSAAYDVLLSALRVQGFSAIEANGVTRIVPEVDAKTQGGAVVRKGRARGDQILTQVFPLKYESASVALPLIRPLVTPNNSVAATSSGNALVVTDYGENLRRLEKLIEEIDQPGASLPYVIPVRSASVLDVSQTLNRLFADSAAVADKMQRVTIVPDLRTNSLIVRSENPSYVERIKALVKNLDSVSAVGGNIHVVYLKNAEATKVAQTLRLIMGGGDPGAPGAPQALNPVASTQNAFASTPTGSLASSASSQGAASGPGMVQADAASNALIITAPEAVYNNLRAVIDKLDVRRAQVHVEALIVELTAEKAAEFGIQWQSLSNAASSGTNVIGGTNFSARGGGGNIVDVAANPGAVGLGLNIGVVRGTVTLPGIGTVLNLGMLARALESDANANILSTPNLLTLDNEEAKIVVGQNVPFLTGQYAQTGTAVTPTPFQTIERKDVGLTLRIKPQISEGGSVRLQIFQEVSSIQDRSNASGLITNKRSIESTVMADGGQIIVLGGLVQDASSDGNQRVPLLGDLPFVGHLFKYESRKRSKTNLMVFLRPTILREAGAYADLTDERYRYVVGELPKVMPKPHPILPDMDEPRLPLTPSGSPLGIGSGPGVRRLP